jgi:metal-responsive CopG/Arc/MetJ family transcriptional regulator
MKTAISLPDELFDEADAVAELIGVSRSHLYATALAEYLAKFRDADVTAQLNAVHQVTARRDDFAARSAANTLRSAEW